ARTRTIVRYRSRAPARLPPLLTRAPSIFAVSILQTIANIRGHVKPRRDHLDWGISASPAPLPVSGHGLTPADLADVARRGRRVEVAAAALERMAVARAAL